MVVSPIRFAFLSDKVLWGNYTLHYFGRILVKVVAKIKQFIMISYILIILNLDTLQTAPSYLVQTSDRLGINHIDFIKGLAGPTEWRYEIPL